MKWYFIGVDLGQSEDYTAIAVLERDEWAGDLDLEVYAHRKEVTLRVRHLERVRLGTSYPEVVERLVQVAQAPCLEGRCTMVVDATGVGRPVVDLLRQARPGCTVVPVLILAADLESQDQGFWRVPKRDLVTGMELMLAQDQIGIAEGLPELPALVEELMEMRAKKTERGREQFGVTRSGKHDDLALALSLACWMARKMTPSLTSKEKEFALGEDEEMRRRAFQAAIEAMLRKIGR